MIISLVVAVSENNVIGYKNKLPWHLPADLKYFKKITMGKPVIMGRKTFASIGKPLPGRKNIVITHDKNYQANFPDVVVVHTIADALHAADGSSEVMIIGGSNVFEQVLEFADRLYLTRIHHEFVGDAFFPAVDWSTWIKKEVQAYQADEDNRFSYSFLVYESCLTKT